MKPTHAGQRIRSAIAPVISAGVITAKVNWKAEKAIVGMVPETWLPMSFRPMKSKLPMKPALPASPKASE